MKKTVLILCMAAGSMLLAQNAVAGTRIYISLGIPVVQFDAYGQDSYDDGYYEDDYYEDEPYAYEDEVWVEGHYSVVHSRYVWVPGYSVPAAHHHVVCLRRPAVYHHFHGAPARDGYRNPPKGSFRNDNRQGRSGYSKPGRTGHSQQANVQGNGRNGGGNRNYHDAGQGNSNHQGSQPQGTISGQGRGGNSSGGNWMNNINNRVIKRQVTQVRQD